MGKNDLNKKKGELEHKVQLATKFCLITILQKHGPILPMLKSRKNKIPNLFEKLTWYYQDTLKTQFTAAGPESEHSKQVHVVEKHHASNLPVLTAAVIFLHARLRCEDNNKRHEFGIQWQRIQDMTKLKGDWNEKGMNKEDFVPSKAMSLSSVFGPRLYVANERQGEKIKKLYDEWKQPKVKGKKTQKRYEEYAKVIEECSMDFPTFVQKLLYDPEENNHVLEAMSKHDSHFKNFGPQHILVGMRGRLTAKSYATTVLKGDDNSKKHLCMDVESEDDNKESDAEADDPLKPRRKPKRKKSIFSLTAEEKGLFKRVHKRAVDVWLDEMEEDEEDRELTEEQERICQKTAFQAVATAQCEKMVRSLGRAAAARDESVTIGQTPNEVLEMADLADDEADREMDGFGAAADMSLFYSGRAFRHAKAFFNTVQGEKGYESVAKARHLIGGSTKREKQLELWESMKPIRNKYAEDQLQIIREEVFNAGNQVQRQIIREEVAGYRVQRSDEEEGAGDDEDIDENVDEDVNEDVDDNVDKDVGEEIGEDGEDVDQDVDEDVDKEVDEDVDKDVDEDVDEDVVNVLTRMKTGGDD